MRCMRRALPLAVYAALFLAPDTAWTQNTQSLHWADPGLPYSRPAAYGTSSSASTTSLSATASIPTETEEIRTQTFLSRPQQTSIRLDILKAPDDPSILGTDYIFTSIYWTPLVPSLRTARPKPDRKSWHPHIFDLQGNLVWHAPEGWVDHRAWSFQSVDFLGQRGTHLAFNDGAIDPQLGNSHGTTRFFNSSYIEVDRFAGVAGLPGPDGHELNMIHQGKRLLHDSYAPFPRDLTGFNGPANGWVLSGCFHERDMVSADAIFTWCSLDYIPIDETGFFLDHGRYPSGDFDVGTKDVPWDYIHINSVDKDQYGDYYISGKMTDAIYKIAGLENPTQAAGEIIWKLGGKDSHFKMLDFNFTGQHHSRVETVARSTSIITLFDNADWHPDFRPSNGKVIEINNETMTARMIEQYFAPNNDTNGVEGTMQRLPNGNMFLAWGPNNILSEHAPGSPGELLWYAKYGSGLDLESYRCFKMPWKGQPLTPPDVFAYAERCDAPASVYMSWNGATEYRSWTIIVADIANGSGRRVATAKRAGFETIAEIPLTATAGRAPTYVYAEALDESGAVLGTSERVKVWVPSDAIKAAHVCGTQRCDPTLRLYEEKDSQADLCRLSSG